ALAHAEFHTPAQVGRKLRSLFAQASPDSFEETVAIARDTRSVRMYPESDGMATIIALLPVEDAQTVMLAINSLVSLKDLKFSEKVKGQNSCDSSQINSSQMNSSQINSIKMNSSQITNIANRNDGLTKRNIEMKRADALSEICGDLLARISDEYQPHRRPVSINITMDLHTALGLADNPAELAGYGPIPASIARQLASDGKWRKFITDPGTGNLLSFGRESYIPPQSLADFIAARDRICRFPGCSQPARVSDIDHAIPWEDGGETSAENLGLLCRRHHRMKTHDGWRLQSNPDGSCNWVSPAGKEIFVPARPINESA
ncbi:MAG: DUF222 domain-containing protein, partial [Candidatus Nanopelagicaceae bacterium]|nr:DUF222 domain-containing protein [Candidatus Nanopelagicaceae bacterium]